VSSRAGAAMLSGIRVLDLSQYLPGPYATQLMQQQGAEIIKLEAPGGDPMRGLGETQDGISPVYRRLHQGKMVRTLDLKSSVGQSDFKTLLKHADVLIEGFRPGVLARLGFADEILHGHNPRLIICHLSGFGQQGADAQRAGHDLGYGARAGLYTRTREARHPAPVYPPVADHAAGLRAFAMICAALYQREKNRQGEVLDISIVEALQDWNYVFASDGLRQRVSGAQACYNIYRCADDRYITLSALEPKFWRAFCEAVERPGWIDRHAEAMPQQGLIDALATLFASRTQAQWQADLGRVDCCFEIVPDLKDLGI